MAIIDVLPGVQIQIIANGTALQEYEGEGKSEGIRTAKRYIEVVPGQKFSVLITLLPEFVFKSNSIMFTIYADGKVADIPLFERRNKDRRSYQCEGREVSGGMIDTFRFAALETGKNASVKNQISGITLDSERRPEAGRGRGHCSRRTGHRQG